MPLKIYRRGDIWHYSGTIRGRRLRGSTGTSEKERAQRIASEAETRAWQGALDGPGATLRFSDCAILYRQAGKSTRFLDVVEDYWRNTLVSKITGGAIRAGAIKAYPKAGPATRNRQFVVPSQAIINHAHDLDLCPHLKVKRFEFEAKIKEPATLTWCEAFAAHASPHLGALCLFMFGTAARLGEAVALLWADVDLEARTAKIRQTKIHAERIAHLPPRVVAALANIPSNRNPDDRVFQYEHRENVGQVWKAAIKRAGIKHLSPHSCRHGFATTLLHRGVDVKTVAERGGWADVATLVKTYAHAMGDRTVTNVLFDTPLTQADLIKAVND